jgi:hypothetical protein
VTFGSLFSGAGFLDHGLGRAGWRCLWGCESDPDARRVLAHHRPGVPFCSRTCLAYIATAAAPTSPPSSSTSPARGPKSPKAVGGTPASGSGPNAPPPGAFVTVNIGASHSGAVASSLSQILVAGPAPSRYCLSPKAAQGILRRAARRGRELPEALRAALEGLAGSGAAGS